MYGCEPCGFIERGVDHKVLFSCGLLSCSCRAEVYAWGNDNLKSWHCNSLSKRGL